MTSEEMARKWIKEWIRCEEQMASGADEGALVLLLDEAREQGRQAERERVRKAIEEWAGSARPVADLLRRLEEAE